MIASQGFEVAFVDDCVASGTMGNLQLNVYREKVTRDSMMRGCDVLERLVRRYPEGVVVISTAHVDAVGLPNAEGRAGIAEANARLDKVMVANGVCLLGEGFWVSAIRSLVTTLMIVTPRPYPTKFFGDDIDAAEWLCENKWNRDWSAGDVPPMARHLATLG